MRGCTHYGSGKVSIYCYISEAGSKHFMEIRAPYRAPKGWTPGKTQEKSRGTRGKVTAGRGLGRGARGNFWEAQRRWYEHRQCQTAQQGLPPSLLVERPLSPKPHSLPPLSFCRQGSSTDHTCGGFGNQKLKISSGFSSRRKDPSPKLRLRTTVWVKGCLLFRWPANSLQPTVIWFLWTHRSRPTEKGLIC